MSLRNLHVFCEAAAMLVAFAARSTTKLSLFSCTFDKMGALASTSVAVLQEVLISRAIFLIHGYVVKGVLLYRVGSAARTEI